MDTPMKVCTKCGQEFPATAEYFPPRKAVPSGKSSQCRQCVSARTKKYREENKDKIKELNKRWRERNADYIRKKNREYWDKNPQKFQQWKKKWREKNAARIKKYNANWQKENPDRVRAASLNYKARKANADGSHTAEDVRNQYKHQKGRCYWCNKPVGDTYHVDHVIPLDKGGSNGPENLVIACPVCNLSKGSKLPHEWDGSGGKLL